MTVRAAAPLDPARAALDADLAEAATTEVPAADLCLRLARSFLRLGDTEAARRWALAVVDAGDDFLAWQGAASVMDRCGDAGPEPRRRARVALLGSFTTAQLGVALRLAAARLGIRVELYEPAYGQYRQEVLDPGSGLYAFDPDVVVLAVHEGDVGLAWSSPDPDAAVDEELGRWTSLWDVLARHSSARVVQFGFAVSDLAPLGHLSARLPGARDTAMQALNLALGRAAGTDVSIVDCERLAALHGKERWFDPRYWHLSKQAVSLGALPLLARHTAAVVAATLGLSRKCLVVDLDNTLWGGVIGEDGLAGIRLGGGAEGEAFVAFQEYLLALKARGVVLAVCSKNNEADAREPFESHPEMRLHLDDIAAFVASWEPKPDQVRTIAKTLDLGLDALVFVDDNPAEREAIRQLCPEVDVVTLPAEPALFARALSHYLLFESAALTAEDRRRTEQYRARADAAALAESASTLDEFLASLEMEATISPVDDTDLERVVQLIGKTNQFNVTSRRHSRVQVERLVADPANVHLTLRLRDRFTDHGLVGVVIGVGRDTALDVDTWLMSCRVLGRTAEATLLAALMTRARAAGYRTVRGTYAPTAKNAMVADLFGRFGFRLVGDHDGTTTWEYDLAARGPVESHHIAVAPGEGEAA